MNEELIIPQWLHDIFLGYGDPGAAHYTGMEPTLRLQSVDCKDTFLDAEHLRDSFPQYEVRDRRVVWVGVVQGRVEEAQNKCFCRAKRKAGCSLGQGRG